MRSVVSTDFTSDIALELKGICKSFGGITALRDVSFQLKRGEFLTMLGPSGSGKTTTLRIIAGFIAPDGGEVWLHGRDVLRTPPYLRNIGMVFQDYALFPHMTVSGNVDFPLQARGVRGKERRKMVADILEMVGLAELAERLPRELSGGQQQRVALARALVFDPEIVLLDEPLGALDKKLRGAMQLEILRVVKRLGATVISVTHDQEEALVMSDRVAIFSQGSLVQIGSPRQLYERPQTEFVADFIGESNIFRGTFSNADGVPELRSEFWRAEAPPTLPGNHGISDGELVALAIRPENLAVRRASSCEASESRSDNSRNQCIAFVRENIYLGVEFRLVVSLLDNNLIQIRSRNLREMDGFTPGTKVVVSWNPSDAVVLRG